MSKYSLCILSLFVGVLFSSDLQAKTTWILDDNYASVSRVFDKSSSNKVTNDCTKFKNVYAGEPANQTCTKFLLKPGVNCYKNCQCKAGFNYSCSGTGYNGGIGSACELGGGNKYSSCSCKTGYTWNGNSCAAASCATDYTLTSCPSTASSCSSCVSGTSSDHSARAAAGKTVPANCARFHLLVDCGFPDKQVTTGAALKTHVRPPDPQYWTFSKVPAVKIDRKSVV